jgi:hypothetical protein
MRPNLRSKRTLALAVAVTALLAMAVSAASAAAALPQFALRAGDSWKTPVTFTVSGSGLTVSTAVGDAMSCSTASGSGTLTGPKSGTATLSFSGCSAPIYNCYGKGMKASEFKTVELEVVPVYAPDGKTVLLELKPKSGVKFAEFESAFGNQCELKGSLLATIGPKGEWQRELTVGFSGLSGRSTWTQYETESHELVNSWLELSPSLHGAFVGEAWSGKAKLKLSRELRVEG